MLLLQKNHYPLKDFGVLGPASGPAKLWDVEGASGKTYIDVMDDFRETAFSRHNRADLQMNLVYIKCA